MSFSIKNQQYHCLNIDPRVLIGLRAESIVNVSNSSDALLLSQPTYTGLDVILYAENA